MTEQTRRASRLVELESRLRRAPQGLTVRQLAESTKYSPRTIQRDLAVLESELGVPLDPVGRRYRLMPGSSPIGAVRFTLHEARAVYLATRLILRHADHRDPDTVGALEKLANALPPAIGAHVAADAAGLTRRETGDAQVRVLRRLTDAWAESRTVTITYRSQNAKRDKQTDLDPYLLEPSATGAAIYVFGYSHAHQSIRTFKVDRISAVDPLDTHFTQPDLVDLRSRLAQSWGGAVLADEEVDVVLEFAASVAERVAETIWHPSQRLTRLDDGRLRFEVRLPSLLEFVPWVRSWGHAVHVLAPTDLREEIAASHRAAAAQYA